MVYSIRQMVVVVDLDNYRNVVDSMEVRYSSHSERPAVAHCISEVAEDTRCIGLLEVVVVLLVQRKEEEGNSG